MASIATEDQRERISKYTKFVSILNKAIEKSHSVISTADIIEQCYGEDATMFETDDQENGNMLVGLLNDALDRIDEEIMQKMKTLAQDQAKGKLNCFDQAIAHVDKEEENALHEEELDHQSAQDAIREAKLPEGVTIEDVLQYQAYLIQQAARDELMQKIQRNSEECEEMKKQLEEKKKSLSTQIETLDTKNQNLNDAADLCTFNGVS